MNITNIECFLAIAELKNISKAAEKLYLSQSAVSLRLQQLEDELGCELIDRKQGHRNTSLTQKGEEFLPLANRWVTLNQDTARFKKSYPYPVFTIAGVDSLNLYVFDSFYKNILSLGLPITLKIETHCSKELYNLLETGAINIAFAVQDIPSKSVIAEPLFKEEMLLVCPEGYLDCDAVHPSQLNPSEELLVKFSNPATQLWHDGWWKTGALPFLEINSPAYAAEFICDRNCWMIVPESVAVYYKENYRMTIHRLTEAPPQRVCYKLTTSHSNFSDPDILKIFNSALTAFLDKLPFGIFPAS